MADAGQKAGAKPRTSTSPAAQPPSKRQRSSGGPADTAPPAAAHGTNKDAPGASPGAAAVAVGASGSGRKRATVFEVDQHHHCVLCPAFTRLVAAKAGGVLVNLDSHDDLGCPPTPNIESADLHRQLSSGDASALKAMDIGTWIMPLVSSGAISTVIWVTAWAKIPKDAFDCTVLTEPEDGTIQVTGKGVPQIWRALWNAAYVEESACTLEVQSLLTVSSEEGTRVVVRFKDKVWYAGRVGPGNPQKGTHTIHFDDGDVRKGVNVAKEFERGNLRPEPPKGKNIGARVRLQALDRWWYGGRVASFDPATQRHLIHFDDGDKNEYDLVEEWKEENLRGEGSEDVVRTPLRVVVVDAKDAVRAIRAEWSRRRRAVLGGTAAPNDPNLPWVLSLDLDFFSTRNPALRSLPFEAFPPFRLALWKIACATPIHHGNRLHAALDGVLLGKHSASEAAEMVKRVAKGTRLEPAPTKEEVDQVVHGCQARFGDLNKKATVAALNCLLNAHLADHQATDDELKKLQGLFRGICSEVLQHPGAASEVVVARSELYTTKRQARLIREEALDIIYDF